jgi:hypothetical protein
LWLGISLASLSRSLACSFKVHGAEKLLFFSPAKIIQEMSTDEGLQDKQAIESYNLNI